MSERNRDSEIYGCIQSDDPYRKEEGNGGSTEQSLVYPEKHGGRMHCMRKLWKEMYPASSDHWAPEGDCRVSGLIRIDTNC